MILKANRGRVLLDARVDLTGQLWCGCEFDGCILIVRRVEDHATVLHNCGIVDCRLEGDGWPLWMLHMVAAFPGMNVIGTERGPSRDMA